MASHQQCFGPERHCVDDETAAGMQRIDHRIEHAIIARTTADEDRIGPRQSR